VKYLRFILLLFSYSLFLPLSVCLFYLVLLFKCLVDFDFCTVALFLLWFSVFLCSVSFASSCSSSLLFRASFGINCHSLLPSSRSIVFHYCYILLPSQSVLSHLVLFYCSPARAVYLLACWLQVLIDLTRGQRSMSAISHLLYTQTHTHTLLT